MPVIDLGQELDESVLPRGTLSPEHQRAFPGMKDQLQAFVERRDDMIARGEDAAKIEEVSKIIAGLAENVFMWMRRFADAGSVSSNSYTTKGQKICAWPTLFQYLGVSGTKEAFQKWKDVSPELYAKFGPALEQALAKKASENDEVTEAGSGVSAVTLLHVCHYYICNSCL